MIYDPNVAASVTATAQHVLLSIIRQTFPNLIAQQILGVQPMTGSLGEIYTMKYKPDTRVWSKRKYNFSRKHWYIAEFDEKNYSAVRVWCIEHFGIHARHPDAWSRWWHKYENKIFFRDEKDYIFFMLRWG